MSRNNHWQVKSRLNRDLKKRHRVILNKEGSKKINFLYVSPYSSVTFFNRSSKYAKKVRTKSNRCFSARGIVSPRFSANHLSPMLVSVLFSRRDRETIEARRDPGPRSSVSGSFSSPPSPLSRRACDLAITWLDHESWNPLSRGGDSSDRVPLFLLLSLPLSSTPVSRCSRFAILLIFIF